VEPAERPAAAPAPSVVERAREADTARVAERAVRADAAGRAATADRVRGEQARRLSAVARRGRAVLAPQTARLRAGQSRTLLRSGPFTLRVRCREAREGATEVAILASSRHRGSLASFSGEPGFAVEPGAEPVLARLVGDRALWLGGRAFTLASPRGDVLHGDLSLGLRRLDGDCVASLGGMR
jgi:hypothetical protein